jgi:arabinofuranosyltransferase
VMAGVFLLYVARVGGDFMEFRLLAPLLPILFLLLDWTVSAMPRAEMTSSVLATLMLALFVWHPPRVLARMEPVAGLAYHIEGQRWGDMGAALRERLPPDTILATTAAGALPYFAQMRTVDMLGLTDVHVAHLDVDLSEQGATFGHMKEADEAYLRERGVNFVFAWPRRTVPFSSSTPTGPGEVIVRLWEDRGLRGVYLVRTPELDERLQDSESFRVWTR